MFKFVVHRHIKGVAVQHQKDKCLKLHKGFFFKTMYKKRKCNKSKVLEKNISISVKK